MKNSCNEKGEYIGQPIKLNLLFASRLIFREKWVAQWFLDNYMNSLMGKDRSIFKDLVAISDSEWVDIYSPKLNREIRLDGNTAFYLKLGTMEKIRCNKIYTIQMSLRENQVLVLQEFMNDFSDDPHYQYNILNLLKKGGASNLRYSLDAIE